eukprot:3769429-Lingulodinium_polyedra.AAC.1
MLVVLCLPVGWVCDRPVGTSTGSAASRRLYKIRAGAVQILGVGRIDRVEFGRGRIEFVSGRVDFGSGRMDCESG